MRHTACCVLALFVCSPLLAALEGVNHAETCGRCHRDILTAWKGSAHALAMQNPIFQDALERAEEIDGRAARQICLGCHAPTVATTGDWTLQNKASWEGVTCDFCHSLKSVSMANGAPAMNVRFDGTKTGPLRDASSIAHGTAYSEVHTSSLACAGCHEYRNRRGFDVLTTYSEWEKSSFGASGTSCQQCHMYETSAQVVDPKIKRLSRSTVNLHEMPGSRSIRMLSKAVQLRLDTNRDGNELVVQVSLENREAGHMVPTGSPLRRLELEVEVLAGGQSWLEKRSYQRRVADAGGNEVRREEHLFLRADREIEDTRLRPGEQRAENFRFPVPPSDSARVNARLWYHYSPQEESEQAKKFKFLVLPQYEPAQRRDD